MTLSRRELKINIDNEYTDMKVLVLILALASVFANINFIDAMPNWVDIYLPSSDNPANKIAVRIHLPSKARYPEGAPILIWVPGGDSMGSLGKPVMANDVIIITFFFPGGGEDGFDSDGIYDHRGMNCIRALRDVILYAMGKLRDVHNRTIDDVVHVKVLHENIGLLGSSNGGNIVVVVDAIYGEEFEGYLQYIIQWESPVSSQIATVDLGRIKHLPNNFVNPRYIAYHPKTLVVDYSDLTYNPDSWVRVFHDGNGDGTYTTVTDPVTGQQTPDLDLDGVLELDEDFPLGAYTDGVKEIYSRPVTHALKIEGEWPADIATPEEADEYWNLREAVLFYNSTHVKHGMILASVIDHVQSAPDKPHIHQAFDGWNNSNAWVKINPSPSYLIEVDARLANRKDLPDNKPNTPPKNWSDAQSYCIPEDISDEVYQLAGIWEMADRAYNNSWERLKMNLYGGVGVSAVIKNVGLDDVWNLKWSIEVEGFVILGGSKSGNIEHLASGEEVKISEFVFGIGKGMIRVRAGEETIERECYMLGPFVIM